VTGPLPEAARLVEAVQTWLHEAAGGEHGGLDTGAPECGACPVCRAAGLLRSADPAVVTIVVEALLGAAVAAADVLREAGDRLLATDPVADRVGDPVGEPAEPVDRTEPEGDAGRSAS
jgi:hypothetical protein